MYFDIYYSNRLSANTLARKQPEGLCATLLKLILGLGKYLPLSWSLRFVTLIKIIIFILMVFKA